MTHFGDGIAVGNWTNVNANPGVTASQEVILIDAAPATIVADCWAASAIFNGAVTLQSGTGGITTRVDAAGVTRYVSALPRAVKITGAVSGTSVTFTVVGWDVYGRAMTEAITGPTTSTATGKKAFKEIKSITTSGTTTSAFTIGTSDVFGLAFRVDHVNYLYATFGTATQTPGVDGGTFVNADLTSPATTTTGDVRGTYTPSAASDGTKRLTITATLSAAQMAAIGFMPSLIYGVTP